MTYGFMIDIPFDPLYCSSNKKIRNSSINLFLNAESKVINMRLKIVPGAPLTISSSSLDIVLTAVRAFLMGFDAAGSTKLETSLTPSSI